eukprot:GFKZ01003158.1.p1 GENE.GFKZ01003158.1~~GFKZ01003158.1.p1  ORF type:complete len:108 (-),score=3.04 GFKZ01003158.1:611-934(-)
MVASFAARSLLLLLPAALATASASLAAKNMEVRRNGDDTVMSYPTGSGGVLVSSLHLEWTTICAGRAFSLGARYFASSQTPTPAALNSSRARTFATASCLIDHPVPL